MIEVPRPANLPKTAKWSKYCRITQDYKSVSQDDYLDKHETIFLDYISCHIKVHGLDDEEAKTWTRKVKEYFELLLGATREAQFPLFFVNRDARGEQSVGRQLGPDGQPILRVDGPYSAPAEHYSSYKTIMLVGAGIGLTPCVSVLTALTKYRWRKNFNPEILHFYWIVRQNEVESFQWLVHMLTEIEFELHKGRETNQIERKYYCEMNIFITGAEKNPIPVPPLHGNSRPLMQEASAKGLPPPRFTAEELFALMMNPPVSSKGQINYMREKGTAAANRLQDIWVWNGRPIWEDIFAENKAQRQDKDIGVCFCGAPVIGADLKEMCEKYSDVKDCVFTLHKENF